MSNAPKGRSTIIGPSGRDVAKQQSSSLGRDVERPEGALNNHRRSARSASCYEPRCEATWFVTCFAPGRRSVRSTSCREATCFATIIDAKRRDVERPEGALNNHRPEGPWCRGATIIDAKRRDVASRQSSTVGALRLLLRTTLLRNVVRNMLCIVMSNPPSGGSTVIVSWTWCRTLLRGGFDSHRPDVCVYVSWDPEGARENRGHEPARFSKNPEWFMKHKHMQKNTKKQKIFKIFFLFVSFWLCLCFMRSWGCSREQGSWARKVLEKPWMVHET
jgi:hypothetical protein